MGLKAAWETEAAFRQEVFLFIILAPLGMWLGESGLERAALVGALFIVLIAELLNSGLEAAIDRIGEDIHPLSKKAKDVGSAAVFIALVNVVVTWGLILV
ncbi:MAG: diacylglycerol kinase [Rhodospirillaceae bacterium]|nr:diacylglycerol kinase [Rhodospirillaceae bacterium]